MRKLVCEKYERKLVFRSWGYFLYDLESYLEVTNQVEPHELLCFTHKHTNGDYHRTERFCKIAGH